MKFILFIIPLITDIMLNLYHKIPVLISSKYNSRDADELSGKASKVDKWYTTNVPYSYVAKTKERKQYTTFKIN